MVNLNDFFLAGPLPSNATYGHYSYSLVFLSYLISAFTSYVALDFASTLRQEGHAHAKRYLLIGGAIAMGAGIWAMNFIGMLAYITPIHMTYSPFWMGMSMVTAIICSWFVLFVLRNESTGINALTASGILLGIGIASMHYMGMASMSSVTLRFIPALFVLSILIAMLASEAALWFVLRNGKGSLSKQVRFKIMGALLMGAGICGMHYTGMLAAVMTPIADMGYFSPTIEPYLLAFYITGVTGAILSIAMLVSTYKQLLASTAKKEKDFLNAVLNNLSDGVLACDQDGQFTVLNHSLQKILKVDPSTSLKENWSEYFSLYRPNNEVQIPNEDWPIMRALRGENIKALELELHLNKHQVKRNIIVNGQPIYNIDGTTIGAVLAVNDITERKKLEGQLIFQATHDALTKLPNRVLLMDRIGLAINQAMREDNQFALLFVDLDHFKLFNDSLGHHESDKLLLDVAQRLKDSVRDVDTVARIGGDEFVIILTALDKEDFAASIAHKIEHALAEPYTAGDKVINMTASIGISLFPRNGVDVDTLLKHADTAMYRAKSQGRNTFKFYTEEMNVNTLKRIEKEHDLRQALKNNEFEVFYQPIVDLKHDHIIAVEALLRWQHPTQGTVMPLDFIPLSEEMGLIIPMGAWVLEAACAQNKKWQSLGFESLNVAVNVSGKQLNNQNFVETVKSVLRKTKLSPHHLELEITESVILERPEQLISSLHELKSLGVQISLDDFGTGYSSLGYLSQLPVNKIKIDKSFIKDIHKHEERAAIVKAIIGIANSMKLKVTAEGMETESERTFLRFNRCDQVQGYYYCKPLSVEACTQFLFEYSKKAAKKIIHNP